MRRFIEKLYKKILLCFVFLAFASQGVNAQSGGTESVFSLGFGAKAIGMGQAFTALADDPSAVFWNPAGLEFINSQSATFFHTTLFEGVQYDFLGYAYPTIDIGSFGFGIGRVGVSGIEERPYIGYTNVLGNISNEQYEVFFSYAKSLPWFDLTPGISVRWVRQGFSGLSDGNLTESGVGADIGLMYRPKWLGNALVQDWSFGLNVRNLFPPQLKVGDEIDEYPLTTKLGIMKKIWFSGNGAINVLLDLDHSQNRDFKVHFGSEYDFRDMGKVRIGYNGSTIAFGVGGKYSIFEIDYGYGAVEFPDYFSATHRISVTVNFGFTRNDMFEIAELRRKENEDRIKKEIREADKQDFVAEHLEAADNFFNDQKYLDAIVEYQQVIGAEPFHFRAGLMLDSSNALLQHEFDQRQSLAVEEALDKDRAAADSMFVQQHFEKGRSLLDQKQFVEAMIEFNIALERNPQNQILQNSISTTKRRIGQEVNNLIQKSRDEFQAENYSEALRLIGDARLLGGTDEQLQNEVETLASRIKLQENIQKGLLLYDVGNYDDALKVLEEALSVDPQNTLVKQYLERAKVETITTQEEMDPETEKKFLRGVNSFLAGKYAEAIQIWEEILKVQPYNKRVLESISNARDRIKNTNK